MNNINQFNSREVFNLQQQSPSSSELKYLLFNEQEEMNRFFAERKINCVTDIDKRLSLHYPSLLTMLGNYRGEQIHYADFEERCHSLQVFTYQRKLYRCNDRSPVNTRALDFNQGGLLVMDPIGNLFLTHKQRNQIHHSSLLAAGPVAYACMLEVRDGVILKEEPWSGHYMPKSIHQAQFHDRLANDCSILVGQQWIPIFLQAANKEQCHLRECIISRKPLFNAVKLPCGHAFNESPIKTCLHKKQICPVDDEAFEISSLIPAPDLRSEVEKQFSENLEKIREYNDKLISRFNAFAKNEPWTNGVQVMRGRDCAGLLLLLNSDLTIATIHQLAISIGLAPPPADLPQGQTTVVKVGKREKYFYGRDNKWQSTIASLKAQVCTHTELSLVFWSAYPPRHGSVG